MTPVVRAESLLPVSRQLALLSIPRSTYYWDRKQQPNERRDTEQMLLRELIQTICLQWPKYGYRRVTQEIADRGHLGVNRKRVHRLMKADNLLCLRRKTFVVITTDSAHRFRVYPNLARELAVDRLNQLWVADITYIHLEREFIYLAVILDAYSRSVIGWALSRHIDAALSVEALSMALAGRVLRPEAELGRLIHHSDRGVQYACTAYVDCLHQHQISISMSRKGNPYDNAKAESFMKTLKQEEVYMNEYESMEHAKENIRAFLYNYNHRRLHSALGYKAPAVFEQSHEQVRGSTTLTTAFTVQE